MVPERRCRGRQCSASPLCGRYGAAGADGTTGAGGVGPTASAVRCSSTGGEPGEESADDAGGRLRVPGFRVSEGSAADAVYVATREGVPPYPSAGPRSRAVVCVERAGRHGDPEAEPDTEWVVYLTYFRIGNSNRTFHRVDWVVRSELQLWLRRKHQCPWRTAQKHWC